jgi:predicted nucleotidyltransferase
MTLQRKHFTKEKISSLLQTELPTLMAQYHVASLGMFGSYVRDEQHEGSDLDLLVTFSKTPGLLLYIELENYLSDLLGVKVDLVMKDALKPNIGERILREVVPI